eukprot:364137-Chlamydomonas_euryale.AAC.9
MTVPARRRATRHPPAAPPRAHRQTPARCQRHCRCRGGWRRRCLQAAPGAPLRRRRRCCAAPGRLCHRCAARRRLRGPRGQSESTAANRLPGSRPPPRSPG